MLKVAIASDNLEDAEELKSLVEGTYTIRTCEREDKPGVFVFVLQINDSIRQQIREILAMVEAVVGTSPIKDSKKNKIQVKARKVASYLLRHRLDLSFQKITEILKYKHHAAPLIQLKGLPEIDVKSISLEVAIRRILRLLEK